MKFKKKIIFGLTKKKPKKKTSACPGFSCDQGYTFLRYLKTNSVISSHLG